MILDAIQGYLFKAMLADMGFICERHQINLGRLLAQPTYLEWSNLQRLKTTLQHKFLQGKTRKR
jgi:hypothetical protein